MKKYAYFLSFLLVLSVAYLYYNSTLTYNIDSRAGEGGEINPSGVLSITKGSEQIFLISPDIGYIISDVRIDGESVGAVERYELTDIITDHTIEASFEEDFPPAWTITASTGEGGFINLLGEVEVYDGENQEFKLTPEDGYRIFDLLIDGESVGAVDKYEFRIVSSDHTIQAIFEIITPEPIAFKHLWTTTREVYDIDVSNNGGQIVYSSIFAANYHETNNPEPVWIAINNYEAVFWSVALSSDGDKVAIGDTVGYINYYSDALTKVGNILFPTWSSSSVGIGIRRGTMSISASGDTVATAGEKGVIYVFIGCKEKTGRNLAADYQINTMANDVTSLQLTSDGEHLVICGDAKLEEKTHTIVTYIDTATGDILWDWVSPFEGAAHMVQISDNGEVVVLAYTDYSNLTSGVFCWLDSTTRRDAQESAPSWMYTDQTVGNILIALSGNGEKLAMGTMEKLHFWSSTKMQNEVELVPDWSRTYRTGSLAISEKGDNLVASIYENDQQKIILYSEDGSIQGVIPLSSDVSVLAVSGDCSIIALDQDFNRIDVYIHEK